MTLLLGTSFRGKKIFLTADDPRSRVQSAKRSRSLAIKMPLFHDKTSFGSNSILMPLSCALCVRYKSKNEKIIPSCISAFRVGSNPGERKTVRDREGEREKEQRQREIERQKERAKTKRQREQRQKESRERERYVRERDRVCERERETEREREKADGEGDCNIRIDKKVEMFKKFSCNF